MIATTTEKVKHPGCPAWCTEPPEHDPEDLAAGGRVHYGPEFGDARVGYSDSDHDGWFAFVWSDRAGEAIEFDSDTAADLAIRLRRVAGDMAAAAEWLERHQ